MSSIDTEISIKTLQQNELAIALVKIFEDLPTELLSLLDEAQVRYMHLIGVTSGSFTQETVNEDRIKYIDIFNNSKHGKLPLFVDDDCVTFMNAVYGIPKLLCRMQVVNDFNWTAASGFTSDANNDIASACNELNSHIKNDDLLQEVITFLIDREMLSTQIRN